jgi:hypothetical protein
MLKETELSKGGEWTHKNHQLHDVTSGLKLKDIGLEKHQSHRYQKKLNYNLVHHIFTS